MEICREVSTIRQRVADWKRQGLRIGLVPTMGYLHEGHLSLIRIARQHADRVVVTLFVNPTQFGPGEDLAAYPRDEAGDLAKCEAAGAAAVFLPNPAAMYAPDHSVFVVEERLSTGLCGRSRPVHFRGVATVVTMLFNICQPDCAVFGEKDAQQLRVIRRLVRDLHLPVEILPGPIVREADGLAMSSRNQYLTPEQRAQAPVLRRALLEAGRACAGGLRDAGALRQLILDRIEACSHARVDYVEVVDDDTLEPVDRVERPTVIALAVWFGRARLLDNLVVGAPESDG